MRKYTENTVPIDEVIENIYAVFGNELSNCKKVELELRVRAEAYKHKLDDIWDEISCKLDSEAKVESTCKKYYQGKNIEDGMCEYRVKIFEKESLC
jgi:ferredoxin-fold anticodon binding domain-containing protein